MSKREEILDAVIALSDHCTAPTELTISAIAEQAGVGKGTVYEYFSSKEEILAEAINHFIDFYLGQLSGMAFDGTFREGFDRIMEEINTIFKEHRSFFRVVFVFDQIEEYDSALSQRILRKRNELMERLTEILARLVQVGKDKGIITGEPGKQDMVFAFICIAAALSHTGDNACGFYPENGTQHLLDFFFEKFVKLLN